MIQCPDLIQLKVIKMGIATSIVLLATGCAIQAPPIAQKESLHSTASQKSAQQATLSQAPTVPILKRKIALGRITNETSYGHSLLRDQFNDPLGKQVTDLMSKALTESGAYLVFERPDLNRVLIENEIGGAKLNLIGVDALIVGSLTEFGRKTVGATGFASSSKRQVAFAKIDIRLVDTNNGQVFFAASGSGEASTETASTFGFGSQAAYDGTLNDAAIRQAVSDAVNRFTSELKDRPWETYILKAEDNLLYISGGKSQGIRPGMTFSVQTKGEKVKSTQTGAEISLPGREVAQIRIDSLFGEGELNEGSTGTVTSGSIRSFKPDQLIIRYAGNQK
ncbi:MAG: CsgG/HfaB family protein [Bdellovibrionia bacterium]